MSDANKLIDLAVKITREHYKKRPKEEAPPMVFGVKDNLVNALISLNFDSDLQKQISAAGAAVLLDQHQCDASIFTSEAWMAVAKGDDDDLFKVRPMNRPDRIEVLMVEVSTAEHYIVAMFKMSRDKKGRLINLTEFQRYDSQKPSEEGMTVRSRWDFFNGLKQR